jgi:arginyl-tRNA synthetase
LPEFVDINAKEQELIKNILEFPSIIQEAAVSYSPSVIANFAYNLVKEYNNYYQSISILNSDNSEVTSFRLALSLKVSEIIKTSMRLLGVNVPDRM